MVASSSADDQEAKRFIASIEDRIDAYFSDISKSDQAVAPPPPLPEGRVLGQSRKPVFCGSRLSLRPFDEQPFDRMRCGSLVVPRGEVHANGREAGSKRRVRSLPPGNAAPCLFAYPMCGVMSENETEDRLAREDDEWRADEHKRLMDYLNESFSGVDCTIVETALIDYTARFLNWSRASGSPEGSSKIQSSGAISPLRSVRRHLLRVMS